MTLEKSSVSTALMQFALMLVERFLAHLPIVSATSTRTELLFTFSGTHGKTLLENGFDYSSYKAYMEEIFKG